MGSFRPVLDRVLISPEPLPEKSNGGIWLDMAKFTSYKGFVVSCGPDVVSVKDGDYVYYDPNSCGMAEFDGKVFHVARDIPDGAIALVIEIKS